MYASRAFAESPSMTSTHRGSGSSGVSSALASRTAASTVSRLRRARPRMLYLKEITSPCSSCAAAPPVEEPEVHTVLARDRAEKALRLVQRPVARDVTGVLTRVAVAEHYVLEVVALGERGAVEGVL